MIIEQSFRALIILPTITNGRKVIGARYHIVRMKKYSFDDEHCLGGFVYRDDPKEVMLVEAYDFEPNIFFYDDGGCFKRIPVVLMNCDEEYRVRLRFRFGDLFFSLEECDVPCVSQL